MSDPFTADDADNPSRNTFLITPHDTNPVSPVPKAIRADGAGTIVFRTVDGQADVTWTVAAGDILPVRAKYVRATGTTVSAVHGLA